MKKIQLLLCLIFCSYFASSQMKIDDFVSVPLGMDFSKYREIKKFFDVKPVLMRGSIKDTYRVLYDDVRFDKYGTADYNFQFVNNLLSNLEIKFTFKATQLNEFENVLRTLRNDLAGGRNKFNPKEYRGLNYDEAINYIRRECKGIEGPDLDNKFPSGSIKSKFFGNDVWYDKTDNKDNRFFLISTQLGWGAPQKWNFDERRNDEYHGGLVYVNISLTNNELQHLRSWEDDLEAKNYTSFLEKAKEISLSDFGGVYKLPVKLNNTIALDFILDLGASDVSISEDILGVLFKAGTISESDYLGTQSYRLADGSTAKNDMVNIKKLTIGDIELENVKVAVSPNNNSPLLLGQSALKLLGKYSIDNKNKVLVVE